jgi:hypothetical protein
LQVQINKSQLNNLFLHQNGAVQGAHSFAKRKNIPYTAEEFTAYLFDTRDDNTVCFDGTRGCHAKSLLGLFLIHSNYGYFSEIRSLQSSLAPISNFLIEQATLEIKARSPLLLPSHDS